MNIIEKKQLVLFDNVVDIIFYKADDNTYCYCIEKITIKNDKPIERREDFFLDKNKKYATEKFNLIIDKYKRDGYIIK